MIRLILIIIFTIGCVSCAKEEVCLIGDSYILSNINSSNINDDFVVNKMTSQNLYYYLDNNAVSITKNEDIINNIKASKEIVISVGIFDIINSFDFSSSEIKYNQKNLENKLELFDYYVYKSFQILNEYIKKQNVFILEQINPLINQKESVFDKYIDALNKILEEHAKNEGFIYIDNINYEEYLIDNFVFKKDFNEYITSYIFNKT